MEYMGPYYKIVRVDESNSLRHPDAPSEGTFVVKWTDKQEMLYQYATKENIASVHNELNDLYKNFLAVNVDDRLKILQKPGIFRGYENFKDAYSMLHFFQIIRRLVRSSR
jgi:hypothetical protein